MIIVKLMGGLGNQMFQYAAGRYLSEKHQTALKLDLTFLLDRNPREDFVFRDYGLNLFNIQEAFAAPDEIAGFEKYHRLEQDLSRVRRKLDSHLPVCVHKSRYYCKVEQILERIRHKLDPYLPVYICEARHHCDSRFFYIPCHAYLDGYWQSEKYFTAIKPSIRNEFTFRDSLDERGQEMADRIAAVSAVCLNVRRGDFVSIPVANQYHGVCEVGYFARATEIIGEKVTDPHFFIFSDDINWCRTNLHLDYSSTLVGHEYAGRNFGQYMQLMIRCQHYIIPNSTFGWWSAWLNPEPSKIVIVPQLWCRNPLIDTSDLMPVDWIRI
jgi:hypothetical protein